MRKREFRRGHHGAKGGLGQHNNRELGGTGSFDDYIRRCVMVSLPLHGEIYAVNGDNIVAINNIFVIIDIHIGVTYTCTVVMY